MLNRASSRLFVFGGMVTLLLIVALTSSGSAAADALGVPRSLGFISGLALGLVLSRALLRWLSVRALWDNS